MPPVIIRSTVALIGLSLCVSAIDNITNTAAGDYNLLATIFGIITFISTVLASVKGSKAMKLIPFIIAVGIGSIIGLFFGSCPKATYGESVSCITISWYYLICYSLWQ